MSSSIISRLPCISLRPATTRLIIARGKKAAPPPKGKGEALKKMPPPPVPPKYRKVCRHVFPYPRCIDLYSLRPEPYCIAASGPCKRGGWLLPLIGLSFFAAWFIIVPCIRIHQIWYSVDENAEDECCDEDEEVDDTPVK